MSSPVDAQLRRHDCHHMGQIAQGLRSGSSPRCVVSGAKYRDKRSQPRAVPSKSRYSTALSEWTTLSKVNSTYRVTYGDLHGDTRNFLGIIRMDKLWYSWSQSEVNVRDRIPRDHPRYSEKVVTFGLRTANVRIETSRERQGVILLPWHTFGSSRERFP